MTCDDLNLTYIFDSHVFFDMKIPAVGHQNCRIDLFGNENYTNASKNSEEKYPGFS